MSDIERNRIEELAMKYAVQNAMKYGKARVEPVMAKIMAELPEYKGKASEIKRIVEQIVERVNNMEKSDLEDIISKLGVTLERKKPEGERKWPELKNAQLGLVVTRVAPEPNGYPTLGHAKGLLVPFIYARIYKGKFLLRFEDTNPRVERKEFYDAIREEFKAILEGAERELGLSPGIWDEEIIESNYLLHMYSLAEKLIEQGDAYVCTCDARKVRKLRAEGIECEHRRNSIERNMELWHEMINGGIPEGEAHLRLKTDMNHPNRTMRDPGIFRIVEAEHPIQGKKYRVYPTYDFSISVMDSLTGVTHAFRSKEFEPHVEVQRTILEKLNLRKYEMIQFGRVTVEGVPLSKRYIRPLIESGILQGWDDPRIPTLRGLFRRGITPEAISRFFYDLGPSKVDSTISMDAIAAYNRKILDPIVPRYMFVPDPVRAVIENFPEGLKAKVQVHPSRQDMGYREIEISVKKGIATLYISSEDKKVLKEGDTIRLRGLSTATVRSIMPDEISLKHISERKESEKVIQWVPADQAVPVKVIKPLSPYSISIVGGFGEPAMKELRPGDRIQLIRYGFARVDSLDRTINLIFSHE
ncbi:glutamate--tRNA ligase [Candidatus Methanodesulfokora washburnensis]|uniref:Glutamate--tRNA ligase n=3 Tax=Candidatus Methanodesulfokora washburnensis TaxID=2478471 RepID=A0A3R9PEH0_9CREN|nr:glutamate--tRNA ligase [Candidatus Methanodesulfokores washburnensis]RSN74193.1 glutamate--tRNA ligase [Candidatus Methanodesulfokores washburnensis]